MKMLYEAHVSDLGAGDVVKVECIACGHVMMIPPNVLRDGLHLAPLTLILDLEPKLRCRECDVKGKAVVSVRWASIH